MIVDWLIVRICRVVNWVPLKIDLLQLAETPGKLFGPGSTLPLLFLSVRVILQSFSLYCVWYSTSFPFYIHHSRRLGDNLVCSFFYCRSSSRSIPVLRTTFLAIWRHWFQTRVLGSMAQRNCCCLRGIIQHDFEDIWSQLALLFSLPWCLQWGTLTSRGGSVNAGSPPVCLLQVVAEADPHLLLPVNWFANSVHSSTNTSQ